MIIDCLVIETMLTVLCDKLVMEEIDCTSLDILYIYNVLPMSKSWTRCNIS